MAWSHPDVSLGELVEQAAAFLDILILASGYQSDGSSAVWNRQSAQKALDWALYFEQVLKKLPTGKEGEASKLAFDLAMDALLAAVPLPPGMCGLSFSTLAKARSFLVQVLVQALPIQNAWLVANFVGSDESGNEDLWEVVIRAMSERCLAFGSVKSVQKMLDVAAGWGQSKTAEIQKVEIWTNSKATFGLSAPSSERWAIKGLKYVTSEGTIHKLSGATFIFSGSKEEWTQVLDSLQHYPNQEGPSDTKAEIAELCCLFLGSSRWKELPRRLLHPACKSSSGGILLSTKRYKDCWVGKNLDDVHHGQQFIPSQARVEVEGYLQNLLDLGAGWWNLAPIVIAAALADSTVLPVYVQIIGKRIADTSTRICSPDCACQTCCQRSDAQERAWCLLVLLDGDGRSDLARQLHGMLGASSSGH